MFYAKWRGWCSECGDEWEEGDEIGYVDDELCCGDCVDFDIRERSDWDL